MTFTEIRKLAAIWDSYGAQPIDPRVIECAEEWVRWLGGSRHWQIVPCSDGSIHLERHADGFDLEFSIRLAQEPAK